MTCFQTKRTFQVGLCRSILGLTLIGIFIDDLDGGMEH